MNTEAIYLVIFGICLGVGVVGAFSKERSPVAGAINLIVALVAGFLSYYAFTESQSRPWGIGYASVATLFLYFGAVSFRGK